MSRHYFAGPQHYQCHFVAACLVVCLTIGCSTEDPGNGPAPEVTAEETDGLLETERVNPVGTLKIALRIQQWDKAWAAAAHLLKVHDRAEATGLPLPEADEEAKELDAETWSLMARAAHHSGRASEAAEYLQRSCEAEGFANEQRVRQAMIAMIGVGRFYQGMEFIERALESQPDQYENRRWLYDFYAGSEDRIRGMEHGRSLIRKRRFDVDLLAAFSNTERRTVDASPLEEMVRLNPDNKRPLLGRAKTKFDLREFDESIRILNEIVEKHPDYHPAQAVLGQAYAATGDFESVESWAAKQTDGVEQYTGYWLALGDWARANGDLDAAARAFCEVTRSKDPDVIQAWARLSTLLPEIKLSTVTPELIEAVKARAKLLSEFDAQKNRFQRTGGISRAIALGIAETLEKLGRLWEAEAWAAVALTLPEDDSVDVTAYRAALVKRLQADTPWQLIEGHPECTLDLSELPLPSIESVVSRRDPADSAVAAQATSKDDETVSVDWRWRNEAARRGLTFFGRTGDRLDQPGVMLYQTLGCGGGTIDFDRDGWSDLYLVAAEGTPPESDSQPNELFRNVDGKFVAVADSAGADDRGFGQGVAVGDANEDGFPDVLVLNYGPNRLLLNNGDGTFRDARGSLDSGAYDEWSSSGAIADVDGDGLSDLVVVNYCGGLGPVTHNCLVQGSDKTLGACTPVFFAAAEDRMLRNDGAGRFRNVQSQWVPSPVPPGRGLGILVGDLDGQGGNELLVANDMTNNHYFSRAEGDAFTLSESAMVRGLGADDRGIAQGSMGIAAADLDRDGSLDVYVTNFFQEYNSLHQQSSAGVWQDVTGTVGLVASTLPLVGFGTEAIDVENDGTLELAVTNGHVDLFARGEQRVRYAQPMQFFVQTESKRYREAATRTPGDYLADHHVGRALWTIDANRDGRVDLVVTHQTEPTALLINRTESNGKWVRLELAGTTSSRDAIGATVVVHAGEQSWTGFQLAGGGYQCSNERILHFGLGDVDDEKVSVEVRWPNGLKEVFEVNVGEQTLLIEGQGE